MREKPFLPYIIEIHLADHCNLNCGGCSHFAPLVHGEEYASLDKFKNDLTRLRKLFNDVYEIRLMGGEPLLHPDINAFIDYSRQVFTKARIAISTNGVLLPKMPAAFWQACARNDAYVKMTRYPIRLDITRIKSLGQEHHVRIKIPPQVNEFFQFVNPAGDSNPARSFRICRSMYTTPFLRDGKLYSCSFAPHVKYFNAHFAQQIPVSPGDYVDLTSDVSAADVIDFLNHPIPLCAWCKTSRSPIKWGVSKMEIGEWVSGELSDNFGFFETQKFSLIQKYHLLRQLLEMKKRQRS